MPVTLATAGLLGLIYIVLTIRVVMGRRATKTNLGDGTAAGETTLLPLIRAHANFAEYVPLALILFGGIEFAGGSHTLLVILACMLIAGRIAHPIGLARPGVNPFRAAGAMLTWLVIIIASIEALILAL